MDVKQEIDIKEEPLDAFTEDENDGDLIDYGYPGSQHSQVCERQVKV